MHIAIVLTGHAYLPEAWAYRAVLAQAGHDVWLADDMDSADGADIAIVFALADQWAMRRRGIAAIHEYHSLSAGRLRHVKDLLKRFAAPRPRSRIFTEDLIRRRLGTPALVPTLLRPVGIDAAIFDCTTRAAPTHDLVYCGSIGRVGVIDTIEALARVGWRIKVVGNRPADLDLRRFAELDVDFTGPVGRTDIPAALSSARFGLNITPDVVPFNRQTSIKTLEYAAAGLGIIANRYPWIDRFARQHDFPLLWLDDILAMGPDAPHTLSPPQFDTTRLAPLEWSRLLGEIGFVDFVLAAARE